MDAAPKFNVFVSYSRSDQAFAKELVARLERRGLAVTIDTRDLPFGEKWQKELAAFIKAADAVIYIVTPRSVASHWCKWELAQVASQSKRLVPVVRETVAPEELPPEIGEVHLFPWTSDLPDDARADLLAPVLLSDRAWVKEHSRLGDLAAVWSGSGRSGDRLLRGQALAAAERWVERQPASAPPPSSEQFAFISASQSAAKRRARLWAGGVSAVAAGALVLAGLAFWQRQVAQTQRDQALKSQSRALAMISTQQAGQQQASDSIEDYTTAALIALEALPDNVQARPRPYVAEAERALANAIAPLRERRFLRGHDRTLIYAAFNDDGTRVVTTSEDGTARVWDVASGKEVFVLAPHEGFVWWAVFSPNGKLLLTVSGGKVTLWDAESGAELGIVNPDAGAPVAAFSPDGTRILTVASDKTARVWDLTEHREALALGSGENIAWAKFSPDGTSILTISEDNLVTIRDSKTVSERAKLKNKAALALFSPDGKTILSFSRESNEAILSSADTGEEIKRLQGHTKQVTSIDFDADGGRALTTSEDGTARIWDAKSGNVLNSIEAPKGEFDSAEFAPGGKLILTFSNSDQDSSVRIWDISSKTQIAVFRSEQEKMIRAAFSRDGSMLVTASSDRSARIWDVTSASSGLLLSGHSEKVENISYSPDGGTLVSASADSIRVWHAKTGAELRNIELDEVKFSDAQFSPDGRLIVTASNDGIARIWDLSTGEKRREFKAPWQDYFEGLRASFSPDGARVIVTNAGNNARNAYVWDLKGGDKRRSLAGHLGAILSASFSRDGSKIVTTSLDGTARIWDAATLKEIHKLDCYRYGVQSASFSPDGSRLATSGRGGAARIWDVKTGRERVSLRGDVGSIWYSRDGKRLVTAVGDSKVKMWDAETGEEIASQEGFGESVRSAVFSPDGTHIATASGSLVRITPTFPDAAALVEHAKSRVSRCLTRDQRLRYIGDPVPPDWCITGEKWPYATPKWKAWLAAGKSSAPPDTADWYSGRFISPRRD